MALLTAIATGLAATSLVLVGFYKFWKLKFSSLGISGNKIYVYTLYFVVVV